jgi:hypothetical protein
MAVDSTVQISSIEHWPVCQSFDPMMFLPEKYDLMGQDSPLSSYCSAPSYYYKNGTKGESYLCDFHYFYQALSISEQERNEVFSVVVSNEEKIMEDFANSPEIPRPDLKCFSCGKDALVFLYCNKALVNRSCNFHYRKIHYRMQSNGLTYTDVAGYEPDILDFRSTAINSIKEDYSDIRVL